MTPEHFQTVALAWLGVISVVGTAAVALVARNWTAISNAIVALAVLRDRINIHDDRAGIDTATPTTLPGTKSEPAQIINPSVPPK